MDLILGLFTAHILPRELRLLIPIALLPGFLIHIPRSLSHTAHARVPRPQITNILGQSIARNLALHGAHTALRSCSRRIAILGLVLVGVAVLDLGLLASDQLLELLVVHVEGTERLFVCLGWGPEELLLEGLIVPLQLVFHVLLYFVEIISMQFRNLLFHIQELLGVNLESGNGIFQKLLAFMVDPVGCTDAGLLVSGCQKQIRVAGPADRDVDFRVIQLRGKFEIFQVTGSVYREQLGYCRGHQFVYYLLFH